MATQNSENDVALLKNLVPLNTLSEAQLTHLYSQVVVEQAKKGEYLFKEGDQDHHNIYLLSGAVALLSRRKEVDVVSSGTQTARFALAHQLPRKLSARAKCPVSFVRIDSRLLSDLLARNQSASYEVVETGDSSKGDWMGQLLQSPIFQQIPPANLQRVMMSMRELIVCANDVIIEQGDEGDYFYLISSGQCRVTRQASPDQPPEELAVLSAGQGFGEEALLSDKPRGSSVTMLTDGVLVRLSKQDFVELVKQPVSNRIEYAQASQLAQENALWIDVRTPEEFEASHLPNAVNLPFFTLRFQAPSLVQDHVYLVYGAEAGQTETAAYLLLERGYEVLVVVEEWQDIVNQAGLQLAEGVPTVNEAADLGQDRPVDNGEGSSRSDSPNNSHLQHDDAIRILTEKLRQYQTEQKLIKQALAVAKRKLELSEQQASESQNTQIDEFNQLQEKLIVAEAELAELKHQRDELRSQLQTAQTEIAQSSQQASERLSVQEQQLAELKQQYGTSQKQLQELQAIAQTTEKQHQERVEKLLSDLADAERQSTHAEAEMEKIVQASDSTQEEYQRQIADAKQEQDQQRRTLEELREKLELAQQESTTMAKQRDELQQARETLLGQIEALQKQNAAAVAEDQERQQNIQQALEAARVEAQTIREEFEKTQCDLKELEQQRDNLQTQFEQEHQTAEFLRRSLETAENAVEISDTMVEENNQEIARLNQQLLDLKSELSGLQDEKGEMEQSHQTEIQELNGALSRLQEEQVQSAAELQGERERGQLEMERMRTEKAHMETELAKVQSTLQANQQVYDDATAAQQHRIDQLEKELLAVRAESERSDRSQTEVQELQIALQEDQQEITRLNKTVEGLREVQLEMENQLSEGSMEELQRLQSALEIEEKKRRQAEEMAKQADVLRRERAVQETAVEMLGEDVENLSRENDRLTQENQVMERRITELLEGQDTLREKGKEGMEADSWRKKALEVERERDQAHADAERLKDEVSELRNVIETHVTQLQDEHVLDANAEVQALRTELEMVRKSAEEDLAQLRSQLAVSDVKGRQSDERNIDTVATIQALRQEIDSIQRSLNDKEQSLRESQSQCRSLEDAIEDRDKEVDHLRRKLESLLRKTSGVADSSEMLISQYNDLSHLPQDESEQITLQRTEQVAKGSKATEPDDQRTSLARLFRKR